MSTLTFKKIAVPVAALAVLAGCETATPYQPLGATHTRGGFTDQQLDATHYRVSFFGNSLTSRQQVENYLLYRAAELTLAHGYSCFTVVNHDTDKKTTIQTYPGYGGYGYGGFYSGWSPYWSMHGPWGWYNYDPFFGGPFSRYDIDTIDRYQAMADIALSNGQCQTAPGTFNAAQVAQNLRPYIVYPQPRRG
jgi:hypothetical protein